MIPRSLIYGVLALAALPRVAAPQVHPHACIWPASQPRCSSWFVTEAGVFTRLTDLQPADERLLFNYTLGWMRNIGARTALGVVVFGGAEGELRGGAALRARKWISPRLATDLAAGVHLFGDASSQDVALGSPMLTVRLTYADKLAVTGRVDVLKLRCGPTCSPEHVPNANATSTRLYLGAEVGSKLGALGGVLGGVLAGVVIAVFAASYGS